ncbi:hypothetical protein PHJA_002665900 [Phtheirospermum japonicum]|uniref:Uncharacterized protein n=1 Tax=Phtheirospermum japonicum TaxID=374723 RepID=A0A830CXF0_9LAMI|nr:hypothetical protein PHJA_002665900 [Phtheirospermum japonicum]
MDNQRSLLLNWTYFHQEKSMDELRQSLVLTMELEDTKLKAQEELKLRDEQISQLKELLNRAIKEKTEAQEKCQKVIFEKLLLQQQIQQQHSGVSSIEDDPRRGLDSNNGFSSSDCDESIVSSPHHLPPPTAAAAAADLPVALDRPLPEKGKLLQAVMKAGPLLQTLLLAGPLPQWRHPPPPLDTYQIPPPPVMVPSPATPATPNQDPFQSMINFNNCGRVMSQRKRGFCEGSDNSSPVEFKYQRVVLH